MTVKAEGVYHPGELSGSDSYGKRFSEVYDTIFPALEPAELDWLSRQVPRDRATASVLEFGVGTGRVLVPLAERLREQGVRASLVGVDASQQMLEILGRHEDPSIEPRLGNMLYYRDGQEYDLVLCVCGSLAVLADEAAQLDAMRTFAQHLAPGGQLVTETHNLGWVRRIEDNGGSMYLPYPGVRRGMVVFSELVGERWNCREVWIDDEDVQVFTERVLLIAEERLLELAAASGLRRVAEYGGLSGVPVDDSRPTVVTVFEKSA
ncbi:class I SAM-dependent methyltransferase [Actinosynnema sp. NPDC050436]|uniref:class I SAM-dependent methyltransferase n=1 Tax=Actinosynnema sp. NPDC050436 TaxID=3155659 RepID=UPI0033EF169C